MGRSTDALTRIGVAYQGDPTDPVSWSGTVTGIQGGLRECGVEVVPLGVQARSVAIESRLRRRSFAAEAASARAARAASHAAATAVAQAGPLDAAIQIGSGYRLPPGLRVASYDDLTVAQAAALAERYGDRIAGSRAYRALSAAQMAAWRRRQQAIYDQAVACCAFTEFAAASIRADYAVPDAKAVVVGAGRGVEMQEVDRDWSTPRFLFVGRDWMTKHGPLVVEAFAAVREHHAAATLDVVGEHPELDAPGVTAHGPLPLGSASGQARLAELRRICTCFVMPSAFEAFGIAYVEAGAYGLPSIGTSVGGAAEVIGSGGVVVAPGDRDGLVAAMLELADPAQAAARGRRAAELARGRTWRATARRVLDALGLDRGP